MTLYRSHHIAAHTRASTWADAYMLADLWARDPTRRGEILRQIEDRIIIDRAAGMMLLLSFIIAGPRADMVIDDIQAHLAPDME